MRRVILLFKFKFIDFAVHATPTCRTDLITCLTFFLLLSEPESFFFCVGVCSLGFPFYFPLRLALMGKFPRSDGKMIIRNVATAFPGHFSVVTGKKASGLVDPIDLFRSTFRPGDFGQIFASPSEMFSDTFLDLI